MGKDLVGHSDISHDVSTMTTQGSGSNVFSVLVL